MPCLVVHVHASRYQPSCHEMNASRPPLRMSLAGPLRVPCSALIDSTQVLACSSAASSNASTSGNSLRGTWGGVGVRARVRVGVEVRQGKARQGKATQRNATQGQARSGKIRKGQERSGQERSGQERSGKIRKDQERSGKIRSGKIRSGKIRSGKAPRG